MDILTPGDRVLLWRSVIDAEGPQRVALLHAVAKDVFESLSALDLYGNECARLTVDSLETLDDAGLFARDNVRLCLERLREPDGGPELLAAEVAGLLREAADVDLLSADRRVRAVEMATEWRDHVLGRERAEPAYLSVADVAARYGVTTQAVYKWLQKGRIEATRGPGGSWRIPAGQFGQDARPATGRERLDELQARLVRLHGDSDLPSEDVLTSQMRDD
jgi:excisionase family DNA binding protein